MPMNLLREQHGATKHLLHPSEYVLADQPMVYLSRLSGVDKLPFDVEKYRLVGFPGL